MHLPLISPYASFFELSVALNFAYAASEQFRESLKSGFLENIRNMDDWYDKKQQDILGGLVLMSNDDIDTQARENIKEKFLKLLEDLKTKDNNLSGALEKSQGTIAKQIKPLYIYVGIFSLIILFFGGQEAIHKDFPIDAMNTMLFFSTIFIAALYLLSFTLFSVTVPLAITLISIALISSLFLPVPYLLPLCDKYLIDCALLIAFLPFGLSMFRLIILTIRLELNHRLNYYHAYKELAELEAHYTKLQESKKYFKQI